MITDIDELIESCRQEVADRGYGAKYSARLLEEWRAAASWLEERGLDGFGPEQADRYLDEALGVRFLRDGMTEGQRVRLRAVRMLVTYQADGAFEFRSPKADRAVPGDAGGHLRGWLRHEGDRGLAPKTMQTAERLARDLGRYLEGAGAAVPDIGPDLVRGFLGTIGSPSVRHNLASPLRALLRWLADRGVLADDLSPLVGADSYRRGGKLPTTYSPGEVAAALSAVDRSSAVGKRDYLVMLLAAQYGMRSGDIVRLEFGDIDWDRSAVRIVQHKTGAPLELPLVAAVGNAVVDYVRHGRPESDLPQVVLSAGDPSRARPITPPTVHSIVTRHLRAAGVDIAGRRHGAHALRHSLAAGMLGGGTPLPTIASVLGHAGTEATAAYLGVDAASLAGCALPVPEVSSPHYRGCAL